jgi:hypothetical protein
VIVLKSGQVVFQGPVSALESHFNHLGFRRPENRDVADFVLAVRPDVRTVYL